MAEPTTVAAQLTRWRDRIPAHVFDPQALCDRHPDNLRTGCPACRTEAQERILAERLAELTEMAADRCDARFPRRFQTATQLRPDAESWAAQFLTDPENAPSLLLLGPTGTGKTYQAYATLRRAVSTPRPHPGVGYRLLEWHAATHADILADLRPSQRNDSDGILRRLRGLPLLLVDDLGVAKNSEWVEDVTYRLINGRYEDMRPTIFTSNLATEQLRDVLGDRIASRLAETCTRIVLTGTDRRRASKES